MGYHDLESASMFVKEVIVEIDGVHIINIFTDGTRIQRSIASKVDEFEITKRWKPLLRKEKAGF